MHFNFDTFPNIYNFSCLDLNFLMYSLGIQFLERVRNLTLLIVEMKEVIISNKLAGSIFEAK